MTRRICRTLAMIAFGLVLACGSLGRSEERDLTKAVERTRLAVVRILSASEAGSGVNLTRHGLVLTNAHVIGGVNRSFTVVFPSDVWYEGTSIAINQDLDLGLIYIGARDALPWAGVSAWPSRPQSGVVHIGNYADGTRAGEQAGDVSPCLMTTARIEDYQHYRLGEDAQPTTAIWTGWSFWGDSGSPLVNRRGLVVAIHKAIQPQANWRFAASQQAVTGFLVGAGCELRPMLGVVHDSVSGVPLAIPTQVGWRVGMKKSQPEGTIDNGFNFVNVSSRTSNSPVRIVR